MVQFGRFGEDADIVLKGEGVLIIARSATGSWRHLSWRHSRDPLVAIWYWIVRGDGCLNRFHLGRFRNRR